jgi:hypothetical protein
MFGDDQAEGSDKRFGPEWGRLAEVHTNHIVIDLLDPDVLVAADRDSRRLWIPGILPVEDDIVGREERAVMPFDTPLQLPNNRKSVLCKTIILLAWNFGCEDGN